MPYHLHYIWWGPVPSDNLESVTEVARKFRTTLNVNLWCSKDYASEFAKVVGSNVNVCALDATGKTSKPTECMPSKVAAVVRLLAENRAYSAIKDVLMLHLLYTYGGGYLDTTTAPMPSVTMTKSGCDTLAGGLATAELGMKNFLGFAFAEVGFGGVRDFYPGSVPWKHTESSRQLFTPSVDYWAAWSEIGNPTIKAALDTYIEFIAKMPEDTLQLKNRDQIIGDLITMSVQYAMVPLLEKYADKGVITDKTAKVIAAQMWHADVLSEKDSETYHANFTLPPIGIMKWHKGSWRNKAKVVVQDK